MLHSLGLVACFGPSARSIVLNEYVREEKSLFVIPLPCLCGVGFVRYIEPTAQINQHYPR